jgi:gliding motility-associated-like protein
MSVLPDKRIKHTSPGFNMKKALIFFFLIFRICDLQASHLVGGEIFYDNLGGNNYKITLKLYRDCSSMAPYDNPAYLFVYNSSGTLLNTLSMTFPGATPIAGAINYPCFAAPANICVEEADYTTTVNLPPIPGGYSITYQRCCRNGTILNLTNPGNTGTTYTAQIPDQSLAVVNSSPRYKSLPPIYICANAPLVFDYSATDPDGDSLSYSMCSAYDGATSCCPAPGPAVGPPTASAGCSAPPPSCPTAASAPPYLTVNYAAPYSGSYPMSANPALSINPITGKLTGTPNLIGQWVVAICVSEYRHGKLISINKRDFQFNTTACIRTTVSAVPAQTNFCFGDTLAFVNNSQNATTFLWNFGDTKAHPDTSNAVAPVHVYSDSGTYQVTLIANPHTGCADTSKTTFYIYPTLIPSFQVPPPQCAGTNSFGFAAGGHYAGNGWFHWAFGAAAVPDTSNLKNPTGIHFNSAGSFPVTLSISENRCKRSFTDTVHVFSPPSPLYTIPPVQGCQPYPAGFVGPLVNPALNPLYSWSFGDGAVSSLANPTHTYSQPGVYPVKLTLITTRACLDTFKFSNALAITVHPKPQASFHADSLAVIVLNPVVHFTNTGSGADSCIWTFGDGTVLKGCVDSVKHRFPGLGKFTVQEIVFNSFGCSDTFNIPILVYPYYEYWMPNAFTPNGDGINEVFLPVTEGVKNFTFTIYNRWGEQLFVSTDPALGWNGTYKGGACQQEVYVWKLEFTNMVTNKVERYMGRVTLVR